MPPSHLDVVPQSPLPIGRLVHFVSGPFANRTVRAELDELQKADLGRKCGNRDRRPLDPPPVVRLKLFEIIDEGTPQETEREISEVNGEAIAYGFICFVDLFPWPPYQDSAASGSLPKQLLPPRPLAHPSGSGGEALPSLASIMTQLAPNPMARSVPGGTAHSSSSVASPYRSAMQLVHTPAPGPVPDSFRGNDPALDITNMRSHVPGPRMELRTPKLVENGQQVAAVVDGVAIPECANCTQAFVGATFVSASCLTHDGKPSLLFVFSDLACNMDGNFLLRYRALNLFGYALETEALPVLAECWGGPVIVYPTKDFPGLAESTELTKYLSRFGVPVNIRQGERKKRGRPEKDKGGASVPT
ncbi:velvet factor [Rhodofomes roseus]|uniref:Velvet factor n=1 Tax=Rhodofomes roseus TaxID=34475 RepID=A0ABQ8K2P8_9APHY|nr:velvet factor [Rhodofomes roseus]KAH9831011.1 velvet factor [Rhodofomes roseus]